MGRNKAFLELACGRTLMEIQLEKLLRITNSVFISANTPGIFQRFGVTVVPDAYPGQGPLAGVHAVLLHAPGDLVVVLACDVPGAGEPLLRRLVSACAGHDAAVPTTADGRVHPLTAVYRRETCLPVFESCLAEGRNGFTSCLAGGGLRVAELNPGDGGFADADLLNVNTFSDLQTYFRRP